MLNIIICDDNPIQTKVMQALLDKYQAERADIELHTHSFHMGNDLLVYIDAGNRADIFLLDILMPEKDGITLAREIRERDEEVPIIFLTTSSEHSMEAFEVEATQYILKPITEDKLFYVLDKVIALLKLEERRVFQLSVQGHILNIPFSSIVYIEFVERKLAVYILGGKLVTGSKIRSSFNDAVAPLLNDERFLHAHKSFVVNMAHIAALGYASFTMKNGNQVPVPTHKYTEAKDKYAAYLLKHGIVKN